MTRSSVLRLLTALALLLGQWTMLAHAGEHTMNGADDALCVLCVQGHSLEQMQLSTTDSFDSTPTQIVAFAAAELQPAQARSQQANIRGPPAHLQN